MRLFFRYLVLSVSDFRNVQFLYFNFSIPCVSLEFDHEVSTLPHPPEMLRKDISNEWRFDRSNFTTRTGSSPFSFLSSINDEDAEELAGFETKFKKFLYGGISVQRLVPDAELVNATTRRERRTLWLMLPEVGSLRLGYISKVDDGAASPTHSRRGGNPNSIYKRRESSYENDDEYSYDYSEALSTGASTFVTEDSGLYTGYTEDYTVDDTMDGSSIVSRQKNVRLSSKHSLALTGVVCLSQEPKVSIRFSVDDTTEHLRVINIEDESGANLLFLANNLREAELLTCGLKLLLERETSRLGLRGGIPLSKLWQSEGDKHNLNQHSPMPQANDRSAHRPEHRDQYSVSSEEMSENDDSIFTRESEAVSRQSWSKQQGREYAPNQTSHKSKRSEGSRRSEHIKQYHDAEYDTKIDQKYVLGKEIIEEVASKILLPLPLPLCRVLLLDSSSPVVMQWDTARGDRNFTKGSWTFPPGNPREKQRYDSEHQLIAKGSLTGAHRTISFDRKRNGSMVRLSETLIVDTDNSEKVAMNIVERMPRRGFAIKIRLFLRAKSPHSCLATVLGEVRPMGRDLSDQAAVHRAFCLVRDEINVRYGMEGGEYRILI